MAVGIQHLTDGTDTAVHHIRRSYHISSGFYMGKGCFCQKLQCPVIVHVVAAKHTAVTVGGILAHAHIGDEIHLREIFSCLTKGFLDDTFRIVGSASYLILVIGNPEKHHIFYTCVLKSGKDLSLSVHTVAKLTRHRRDLLDNSASFFYKHRIDQRCLIHSGLPNHFS